MSDLSSVGSVVIGKINLLAARAGADKGDGAGGDALVSGKCLDDIVHELVRCRTGTPLVSFFQNNLPRLDHLALQDSSCIGSADRERAHSRLNKGKPASQTQIILHDLACDTSVTATDAREGNIERITLSNCDRRRIGRM